MSINLLERVVADSERILGDDYPSTAVARMAVDRLKTNLLDLLDRPHCGSRFQSLSFGTPRLAGCVVGFVGEPSCGDRDGPRL